MSNLVGSCLDESSSRVERNIYSGCGVVRRRSRSGPGPGLVITTICHLPSAVINPQPTFVRPPSALEEYQCVPLRR